MHLQVDKMLEPWVVILQPLRSIPGAGELWKIKNVGVDFPSGGLAITLCANKPSGGAQVVNAWFSVVVFISSCC